MSSVWLQCAGMREEEIIKGLSQRQLSYTVTFHKCRHITFNFFINL